MKKILVINGPNLNMLGKREKKIYGDKSLEKINASLDVLAKSKNIDLEFFQSNHEGEIIYKIHNLKNKIDGCIINAGALTHSSTALHDAIKSVEFPFIEVHMSNIYSRKESWRHTSLISPVVVGTIQGFGEDSYRVALDLI